MDKPNYNLWTEQEEKFLIRNYGVMTSDDIALELGRDRHAVNGKAYRLREKGRKIYGKSQDKKRWTKEEEQYLKDNYGKIQTKEIIENLNTTRYFVYQKAEELKLKEKPRIIQPLGDELDLRSVKVVDGKEYEVYKVKFGENKQKRLALHFKGVVIHQNQRHITLQEDKHNIRETFLRSDLVIGEYRIKEII